MKKIILITCLVFCSNFAFGKQASSTKQKPVADSHNTIYTAKIKRVVNAVNIGDFTTDSQYYSMLKTACERNKCTNLEKQTIQSVGKQLVACQIKHLKSHGIENPDATNICGAKQAIFGCDSLASPLLRKMCYSGNKYSLNTLQQKERKIKSRAPASTSKNN